MDIFMVYIAILTILVPVGVITIDTFAGRGILAKVSSTKAIIIYLIILGIVGFGIRTVESEYNKTEARLINEKYDQQLSAYNQAVKLEKSKTATHVKVTINKELLYNNHVGNEWYYEFYVDNTEVGEGLSKKPYVKFGEPITISAYYAEDDTYTDSNYSKGIINPTKEQLISGVSYKLKTTVRENQGRYTGNTAQWETTFHLKAIMNYPERPNKQAISIDKEDVYKHMWNRSDTTSLKNQSQTREQLGNTGNEMKIQQNNQSIPYRTDKDKDEIIDDIYRQLHEKYEKDKVAGKSTKVPTRADAIAEYEKRFEE